MHIIIIDIPVDIYNTRLHLFIVLRVKVISLTLGRQLRIIVIQLKSKTHYISHLYLNLSKYTEKCETIYGVYVYCIGQSIAK